MRRLCLIGGHLLNIRPQKSKMSNYIKYSRLNIKIIKILFSKLFTKSSYMHKKIVVLIRKPFINFKITEGADLFAQWLKFVHVCYFAAS
jgi:hypothetical protein